MSSPQDSWHGARIHGSDRSCWDIVGRAITIGDVHFAGSLSILIASWQCEANGFAASDRPARAQLVLIVGLLPVPGHRASSGSRRRAETCHRDRNGIVGARIIIHRENSRLSPAPLRIKATMVTKRRRIATAIKELPYFKGRGKPITSAATSRSLER